MFGANITQSNEYPRPSIRMRTLPTATRLGRGEETVQHSDDRCRKLHLLSFRLWRVIIYNVC